MAGGGVGGGVVAGIVAVLCLALFVYAICFPIRSDSVNYTTENTFFKLNELMGRRRRRRSKNETPKRKI